MATPASVVLRVFLHGLILYVADPKRPDPLEVLLIDARHPPAASDGCPIHSHIPELIYQSNSCKDPCHANHGFCHCELNREEVVIGAGQKAAGASSLGDVKNFARYVTRRRSLRKLWWRMKRFNRVQPDCRLQGLREGKCPYMAAAAALHPQQVIPCRMAEDPSRPSDPEVGCGDQFRFESLRGTTVFPHKQPFASVVLAAAELPPTTEVTITIEAFDHQEKFDIQVPVADCYPGKSQLGKCADVVLTNRPEETHGAMTYKRCDDPIARHFELLLDFFERPLLFHDLPVPKLDRTVEPVKLEYDKLCESTLIEELDFLRSSLGKPICPQLQTQ